MEINQKFVKKAMIAASLTMGVIGYNSLYNETKALADSGGQTMEICPGSGEKCTVNITFNGTTGTVTSEKTKGGGSVIIH